MGPYMSQPKTDKKTIGECSNSYLKFAMAEMQGWRNTMEDSHIADINIDDDTSIFGVFDGHGGHEVAKFVEIHFVQELKKNANFKLKKFEEALRETFLKMDELMLTKEGKAELIRLKNNSESNHNDDDDSGIVYAGCTANVALIHKKQLYVANSGDSRTVLYNKGNPVEMSIDHKPEDPQEKSRISKAGGFVQEGRVNGNLNLSRAFGDFEYKKGPNGCKPSEYMITAFPDVKTRQITPDDKFMLMGCDGIWECMNNQDLGRFCQSRIDKQMNLKDILIELLDTIIAKDTTNGVGCDNMTSILVQFK